MLRCGAATLLLLTVALAGCTSPQPQTHMFRVDVHGTSAIPFSMGYVIVQPSGQSQSNFRDGVAPSEYTFDGAHISVNVQKTQEWGRITVEIYRDGVRVAGDSTEAAFGIVGLAV